MRIALPLLLSLACLGLGGCGQKGPLFIPSDDSPPAAPSTTPAPAKAESPAATKPTPSTPELTQ